MAVFFRIKFDFLYDFYTKKETRKQKTLDNN